MERGDLEQHEIYLSGLRVAVKSSCNRTSRYLRRHWMGAAQPLLEPEATCEIEVVADPQDPRIIVDGDILWSDGALEDLVAGFEQWLYRLALARHRRRFIVVHGAAVVKEGKTVVFSGPSGAGKSSLALTAVRRGWKYFSDEFVVTDGERVWGWPRAIRFDPSTPRAEEPTYLRGLEVDDDAVESPLFRAPYYPVAAEALQRAPCSASRAHFVRVERASGTSLTPVSTAVGLKHWTEASVFEPPIPLGALSGRNRVWRGRWRDPDELMDMVEAT